MVDERREGGARRRAENEEHKARKVVDRKEGDDSGRVVGCDEESIKGVCR